MKVIALLVSKSATKTSLTYQLNVVRSLKGAVEPRVPQLPSGQHWPLVVWDPLKTESHPENEQKIRNHSVSV
jgi:hypothetical protein